MIGLLCSCGADATDYMSGNPPNEPDCHCAPVFRIALILHHFEQVSRLTGLISPAVFQGVLTAIEDVIANDREGRRLS